MAAPDERHTTTPPPGIWVCHVCDGEGNRGSTMLTEVQIQCEQCEHIRCVYCPHYPVEAEEPAAGET